MRDDLVLAVETTDRLETLALERAVLRDDFRILRTIPGVGKVLGLLIMPEARRFYDRKVTKTKPIIAARALAHKLAKATYFMLRDQVPYDAGLLFR